MMINDFILSFGEFLDRNGRPADMSPWDVVERWEQFADTCGHCYQWGFYEFDNDVRVRTLLEQAFTDSRLTEYPQLQEMRKRVEVADERFRGQLSAAEIRGQQNPWWERAVLARAGDEYRDDVKRLYGIDVMSC